MSVWDVTTPAGSEAISLGDDRIRELKLALQDALSADGTFPGASPATTPIFIPGIPRDTTANRPTGDRLVSGRLFNNTTLNVLERYNGGTWDVIGTAFASGTALVFYQASAPTGWTAVAANDLFLRVVSAGGTGGTGGGSGLRPSSTISLAHAHTVAAHTHTIAADAGHTHSISALTLEHTAVSDGHGANGFKVTSSQSAGSAMEADPVDDVTAVWHLKNRTETGTTGSGGSHSHGGVTGSASPATDSQLADIAFRYVDVIIATKD